MRPLGHLAGGYLVARAFLKLLQPPPAEEPVLLALGAGSGLLPDADTLVYVAKTGAMEFGEDFDHHRWVSHTFPVYLAPGLLLYAYARRQGRQRLSRGALVTLAGTIVHLLQDTIGSGTGLMWAWPFSRRMDGICTLHVKGGRAWLETYTHHPIAWVERSIILAAVAAFAVDVWGRLRK